MAATPSTASPCFAKRLGWPERPDVLDRMEVAEGPGSDEVTATAYFTVPTDSGPTEMSVSKTVKADDKGLRWQTSESPPMAFPKRADAERREAAVGGSA